MSSKSETVDAEGVEEFDDSVPQWELHQQAVMALTAHEGHGFDSIAKGGRDKTVVSWEFNPLVLPSYVNVGEHPTDPSIEEGFYTVTGKTGKVTSFQIFNPDLRTEEQPIGAVLGEVSERYTCVSYPVTFAPFAVVCNNRGWDWKITSFDQGKVARMDIVVADAAELGTDKKKKRRGDVYKYGLTIWNSLDGSSGLRVTAFAERLVCTNGQVAMQKRQLFSAKHTAGAIGAIDFEKFAAQMGEMAETVKQEILQIEEMKYTPMSTELFDRLQVEAARRGIITMPRTSEVADPLTGNIVDVELKGGYGWRINREGWENPHLDWVKVDGENLGTLFQAYQVMTGGLTWKPKWEGPKTWNGEQQASLTGHTLNMKTLERRLHAVHTLLRDVLHGQIDLETTPSSKEKLMIELVH